MEADGSILLEKHRILTLPKELRAHLKADGWKDCQVTYVYDDKTKVLHVVRKSERLENIASAAMLERIRNADEEICHRSG